MAQMNHYTQDSTGISSILAQRSVELIIPKLNSHKFLLQKPGPENLGTNKFRRQHFWCPKILASDIFGTSHKILKTRVLPSISIDNGVCRCAGTAVLLHVQKKFWIISAESNDLLALAQHIEHRDAIMAPSWLWISVLEDLAMLSWP